MPKAWRVVTVLFLVIVLSLLSAAPGLAGAGPGYSVGLTYWPASVSAKTSAGSQFATWNSALVVLELRGLLGNGPWGFGAEYGSGPQSSGTGSWASLTSGSDNFWSAYAIYRITPATSPLEVNLWGGYGYYNWDSTFSGGVVERFSTQGFMLGVSVYTPIAPNLEFGGDVRYFPSNSTSLTSGGATTTSSASAWDYRLFIAYEQGPWELRVGWRGATLNAGSVAACGGCTFGWSGFTVGAVYNLP